MACVHCSGGSIDSHGDWTFNLSFCLPVIQSLSPVGGRPSHRSSMFDRKHWVQPLVWRKNRLHDYYYYSYNLHHHLLRFDWSSPLQSQAPIPRSDHYSRFQSYQHHHSRIHRELGYWSVGQSTPRQSQQLVVQCRMQWMANAAKDQKKLWWW